MSSWGFFAMLGLFPMVPGTATMAVGSPEFSAVVIRSGARTLTVSAPGAGSGDLYVQASSLDGAGPLGRPSFTLPLSGVTSLTLEMGPHPAADGFTTTAPRIQRRGQEELLTRGSLGGAESGRPGSNRHDQLGRLGLCH